uniref:Nudix hydrolase domain-containing protein n=1 Tax=Kwoniella pini CBS 10737 TaxID=1296096 RepID=A0A1B9HUU1_9TREE|nr:uncharacterized protein I206_06810 [Kwoniella pini CBS 10737]OCF47036.1 hypothetical protein I206_06810 [Kwoniella pini CBS 10737]
MIDVERPSEYERLDSEESEIPHEFRHLRNLRSPFACRAPSEGWEAMDGDDVTRSPVEYTLIFPVDLKQSQVLLGLKRRGMGYNLYNGFGGKVEKGETVWEGAIRELQEETGLIANDDDFYYKGCLYSSRPLSPPPSTETCIIKIHFFACVAWRGQAVTTEEMIPEWFPLPSLDSPELHRIPVDQMVSTLLTNPSRCTSY